MKLGIIGGAGLLGSTTAFFVGSKHLVDEIKLIDIKESLVKAHCMDMTQAFLPIGGTKVTPADYEDLRDCDIVLSAAALPEGKIKDRNENLKMNLEVILPICEKLKKYCSKNTILITSAAPIDVLIYIFWTKLGWNPRQFFGFSTNDEIRLKWAIGLVTGKEYDKLHAICIGEHGASINLYDQLTYEGKPFKLTEQEEKAVCDETANWFVRWKELDSGRTTGWTSAVMLTAYIEAIVKDSDALLPVSSPFAAKSMGYDHSSFSLPSHIGRAGIKDIVCPRLNTDQKKALDETAKRISDHISVAGV